VSFEKRPSDFLEAVFFHYLGWLFLSLLVVFEKIDWSLLMKDFRGLAVWKQAHLLVLNVYRVTESFPRHELFGLTSQIRRAAASIPTNIAEGCGRDGDAELGRFLNIAKGSTSEVEYLLQLSRDLNYLEAESGGRLMLQTVEIRKMLYGLQKSLGEK